MQIVINSYGSYIRKNQNCFLIKNEDKTFEVSAEKVDSILISTSASISTDAIEFAVENNIDIVFLNKFGNPYGRVWHAKLGSTALIRRKQLEAATSGVGFLLVKGWIEDKIHQQITFLKDLRKNRPSLHSEFDRNIEALTKLQETLKKLRGSIDENRSAIMGVEGMASSHYFGSLSIALPEQWRFSGRSRDPAQDEFNCLLNYGYGVLYSHVEKGCIIAGLDPYVGFLHTDNYNKKSFVFDLIEIYRIYIDRTVMRLFGTKQIKSALFDPIPGGMLLNQEGKAVLISALNETFDQSVSYRGRNIKVRNMIPMECHRIANSLIKPGGGS
ncbi:CRISPR-associated endonuclease Cas1 [Methanosalsum natronophilum]|uniref:CRISPR-associated endonuclease Cas1 n=1 Tax=Methanosalsum natronophilum TaxID=768733 RepID=A0A424Z4Q5_9EURY|nr:MAG: CRISPR-associated endonuclease Cas1 [Methanosalsum natronophilum]